MSTRRRVMWGLVVMAVNATLIFGVKQWVDDDHANGAVDPRPAAYDRAVALAVAAPVYTANGGPSSADLWCFAYSSGIGFWNPWGGLAAGAYCLFMPDNTAPIEPKYRCFMKAPHADSQGRLVMPILGTPSTYQAGRCKREHFLWPWNGGILKIEIPVWGVQVNRMYAPWIKFSVNA